jgi:hypothetical protein
LEGVLTPPAPLPISEGRSSGLDDVDPLHSASVSKKKMNENTFRRGQQMEIR